MEVQLEEGPCTIKAQTEGGDTPIYQKFTTPPASPISPIAPIATTTSKTLKLATIKTLSSRFTNPTPPLPLSDNRPGRPDPSTSPKKSSAPPRIDLLPSAPFMIHTAGRATPTSRTVAFESESEVTPKANLKQPFQVPPPPPLVDGPLFRAITASLLKRAAALRVSLKVIVKNAEVSLEGLKLSAQASDAMDEAIKALSVSSSTTKSESLGGLYEEKLAIERSKSRASRREEIEDLQTFIRLVTGSSERLKTVEAKKKSFDTDTKRYYDDVTKVCTQSAPLAVHALIEFVSVVLVKS